jgi:8-oxo-dGTP diphosphatase
MQGYNVIMLYDENQEQLLMCRRRKNPYKGMRNLIGGKIEPGEGGLAAAYRELFEEAGVSGSDVRLTHLMDFKYYLQDCYVEVYAGKLRYHVDVYGDENDLYWSDLNQDFFDLKLFAGEGNIGHMVEQVRLYADEIFRDA